MKTRFTTESGSLYEIDSTAMTWTRLQHDHAASPYVRSESGDLKELPEIVVGKPVTMKGTAFDEVFKALGGFRLIYTSNVKEIIVPPEVLDSMHTVSQ